MLASSIMDKWSTLGDNGSKSAGNPGIDIDKCVAPARAALATFALNKRGEVNKAVGCHTTLLEQVLLYVFVLAGVRTMP